MKAKRDLCDKEVINGFSFFSFCFSLSSPSHTQTHTQPTGLSSVCFLKTLILLTSKDRNELLPCKYRQLVFPHMHTRARAQTHKVTLGFVSLPHPALLSQPQWSRGTDSNITPSYLSYPRTHRRTLQRSPNTHEHAH